MPFHSSVTLPLLLFFLSFSSFFSFFPRIFSHPARCSQAYPTKNSIILSIITHFRNQYCNWPEQRLKDPAGSVDHLIPYYSTLRHRFNSRGSLSEEQKPSRLPEVESARVCMLKMIRFHGLIHLNRWHQKGWHWPPLAACLCRPDANSFSIVINPPPFS